MSDAQSTALDAQEPRDNTFLRRLMKPAVDRSIAVVAILPIIWAAYFRHARYGLNPPVFIYWVRWWWC
jgi:hypothetical protein